MEENEIITTGANNTGSTQGNPEELLRQSPFGPLFDIPGVDGVEDIFGNVNPPSGGGAFGGGGAPSFDQNSPYGGNPFAGDNFWNAFAGGVNPSNPSTTGGNNGGGFPGGGGGGNTGGFPGGGNGGGSFSGGTPANPLEGDNFWDAFAGGVNPTEFSSDNLPSQAFVANNSGGGTTPVPEPSSMIGVAVIGLGIAAGKFKQRRRATKASQIER